MKELSLHILDILQNSIVAEASLVELTLIEDTDKDLLSFTVKDNGKGMTEELVRRVIDPFVTGRTTRKVGLGIPLLKMAAEHTGGGIALSSVLGEGTTITARFGYSHIDRQPLGNMAETMLGVLSSYDKVDFVYLHRVNEKEYTLDTRQVKEILGGVSLQNPDVLLWLSEFLRENEAALYENHPEGEK